jgi:hypothetical protein
MQIRQSNHNFPIQQITVISLQTREDEACYGVWTKEAGSPYTDIYRVLQIPRYL